MQVTIGRWVHYTLTEYDAERIEQRRRDALEAGAAGARTGHQTHVGNLAEAGQTFPAVVVRVFDLTSGTANLRVMLDGTDELWATSVKEGDQPGTWAWPARVS